MGETFYTKRIGSSQNLWPEGSEQELTDVIRELLWRIERLESALGGGDAVDELADHLRGLSGREC